MNYNIFLYVYFHEPYVLPQDAPVPMLIGYCQSIVVFLSHTSQIQKRCNEFVTDGTILWEECVVSAVEEGDFLHIDWDRVRAGEVVPAAPKTFLGPEFDFVIAE